MAVETTAAEGRLLRKWLENLSWIDKIAKIYEMLLKNYILVGLGKIFGRSVKNFGRTGQF